MAIKGKKKSQARGSQARRHPAAMPRATVTPKRVVPWYKTNAFRASLIVAVVVILAVVAAIWNDRRTESQALEEKRDELNTYVTSVQGLLQNVTPVGSEMDSAPTPEATPSRKGLGALAKDSESWATAFEKVRAEASGLVPPAGAEESAQLFAQSLGLYRQAAFLYGLATEAEKDLRGGLLEQAAAVRDRATGVWLSAVSLLDGALLEAEGDPSGLSSPSQGALTPPVPEVTPGGGETTETGG